MMKPFPKIKPRPATVQREFRGVNRLDSFSIADEFATDTKNMTAADYPALSVRPGYSVLGTFGTRVLGMGVWQEKELHVVTNDGRWRRLNADGTWTELASGLSTSAVWTFTNFKGNLSTVCLIGSNGVDSPRYYNGTTLSVLGGVPAGAKYITAFADRLWAAVGIELKASAYRMADDWTTVDDDEADSWYAVVESPDGEDINGIMAGMTKLVITKPSATFKLMGYAPSDYELRPVTFNTGQFNNQSAFTLDGWMYQLTDTGLHRYAGGSSPERGFSERIKDYFDRINQSGKTASCIGSDGTRLYISIPMNSSTPDTIIEYDPQKDTYNPWYGISALHFAQVGTSFYIGDATGRVLKLGGTTDGGNPITWEIVSKPFTGPSMSQKIRWMREWITVDLPTGSTMTASLSKSVDAEDWEQVGTITASSNVQRKPIYVASGKVANADQLRYKVNGVGTAKIHEIAWESQAMPLR